MQYFMCIQKSVTKHVKIEQLAYRRHIDHSRAHTHMLELCHDGCEVVIINNHNHKVD